APRSVALAGPATAAPLLQPRRLSQDRARLQPHDWYVQRHRVLYQAYLDVTDAGYTPDLLTLQAHLEQAGMLSAAGGLDYLTALDLDLPDLGRLDEYVEIVKERS